MRQKDISFDAVVCAACLLMGFAVAVIVFGLRLFVK